MPDTPIIDTHVHLWDPSRLRYPWLDSFDFLNRRYLAEDYDRDFAGVDVEAMVFVEADVEPAAALDEARWVSDLAMTEPRLKAIVAAAPLEQGRAVAQHLDALKELPLVRGVRRILQGDEPDFCLRPDFIDGVRLLADYGFSFDICVNFRHMASIVRFAEKVPDVALVLDHIGKPSIRDGTIEPWASHMRELAGFQNVVCKVSGVATEARSDWGVDDLMPYLDVAFAEFGTGRTLFGGDWPVALLAITPAQWVEILDKVLADRPAAEKDAFWRGNAVKAYGLAG